MIQNLPKVILKNGDGVAANIIRAPEEAWRERVAALLQHKGDPWRWQIAQLLAGQKDIESRFYLLHYHDVPFCNILTIEENGVGLLGHVWTKPENRGQGAASQLMRLVMEDFRMRGGQALFLGTGYETAPYHIYHKQGFRSIEVNSGVMAFFRAGREEFESNYFAPNETTIAPLSWSHYATASALLAHKNKTRLRCAPLGVLLPSLCESAFLPILRECETGDATRAVVLQKPDKAVVGLAAWDYDAFWPDVLNLDIFCHTNFWHRGEELLVALKPPVARRYVIYDDEQNPAKTEMIRHAGFEKQSRLKNRVPCHVASDDFLDVSSWERAT